MDHNLRYLLRILDDVADLVHRGTVRERVQSLVQAQQALQALGRSAVPADYGSSARDRILAYMREHVGQVIDGTELAVVAGISEYARRIRELRTEEGWLIISGVALSGAKMGVHEPADMPEYLERMRPDQYCLLDVRQDVTAARRWRTATEMRRSGGSSRERLLAYLRVHVGAHLTAEELRFVAGDVGEWGKIVSELRSEDGWPILTRWSGGPRLPIGVYMLAADRQDELHDRRIDELTRRAVLQRDGGCCRWKGCSWPLGYPDSDERYLEIHQVESGGSCGVHDPATLVTLCFLHHDEVHRGVTLRVDPPVVMQAPE